MRYESDLHSAQSESTREVFIGDIPIDILTMEETVRRIGEKLHARPFGQIVISGVNAHFVNFARKDPRFKTIMRSNSINVADGVSLVLSSFLLRPKLPERVPGIDLMLALLSLASEKGKSVYLLGGREGAAEKAAVEITKRLPNLKIVGIDRPPIGKEFDHAVAFAIRERIRAVEPDFLFVCFGVPKQEYWIQEFARDLPVRVLMGNGAAFDVLAGFFRRPPQGIQDLGLEWLYRLLKEPRRLWYRYSIGNLKFALIVFLQLFQPRTRAGLANSGWSAREGLVHSWPEAVGERKGDAQASAPDLPWGVQSEGGIADDGGTGDEVRIGRAV